MTKSWVWKLLSRTVRMLGGVAMVGALALGLLIAAAMRLNRCRWLPALRRRAKSFGSGVPLGVLMAAVFVVMMRLEPLILPWKRRYDWATGMIA